MDKQKPLSELNLLDRFLFSEVMSDIQNTRLVLEIIFSKTIELFTPPQTEKEIGISPLYRTIRLDVWAQDIFGCIYNTEAQQQHTFNLPRRSRFYQSLTDSRLLPPGTTDFNQLNDIFIIVISPFDIFGKNRYCYTFEMMCREDHQILLSDGAVRLFLNCHGTNPEEVNPELVELLHYMEHTTDEFAAQCKSSKIKQLHTQIQHIRNNEEIGVKYMQAWEERILDRQEGFNEGISQGTQQTNSLYKILIDQGRLDDMKKAISNSDYYHLLLKEFNLCKDI